MNTQSQGLEQSSLFSVPLFASLWAFFGFSLALFIPSTEWPATVGVLMVNQALCGVLVWHRFKMTASAVLPDFLTMYLFMQFVNKSLTLLGETFVNNVDTNVVFIEPMLRANPVGMEYRFQAELIFLIATVTFTLAWRWLEGRNPLAVWHEPEPKVIWLTYAAGLGGYTALTSGAGASFGAITALTQLFAIGAIATLLGGRTDYALGQKRMWLSLLALVPLYILAFRTGMKGEVALVSLPILLPIFRRITMMRLLFLVGFVGFVVTFVFPFSQAWREANWVNAGGDAEGAGILGVTSRVLVKWEENGILNTAAEGGAQWMSRGSTSEQGGLVMMIAERDGLIGPVLLEGLSTIFVPRILWPDKPIYQPGAWFTWYLGFADSPETATTATAMMLSTELYWMFGILGVLCGMPLLAMLYFHTWRFILRRSVRGLVPLVALFGMLARSADLDNTHIIYAISSPIILVGWVVIIDSIFRIISFGSPSNVFRRAGKQ